MKTRACSLLVVGVSVAALCGCANMQNRSRGTTLGTAAQGPPSMSTFNSGPSQLDLNAPLAPPPPPMMGSAGDLSISTGADSDTIAAVSEEKISKPTKTVASKSTAKSADRAKPYNLAKKSETVKKSEPSKKTEVAAKKADPLPSQNKTIAKLANLSGDKPAATGASSASKSPEAAPSTDTTGGDDMLGLPVRKNENSDAAPVGAGNIIPVSNPEARDSVNTKNVI